MYGEGKREGSEYLEFEALREGEWRQMSQQLTWLGMAWVERTYLALCASELERLGLGGGCGRFLYCRGHGAWKGTSPSGGGLQFKFISLLYLPLVSKPSILYSPATSGQRPAAARRTRRLG